MPEIDRDTLSLSVDWQTALETVLKTASNCPWTGHANRYIIECTETPETEGGNP
jgi:hypothetical protein